MNAMFTGKKAAQMCAFFIQKAGGTMEYERLLKFLYLADRDALALIDATISNDDPYSMKRGIVLSRIYDLILGKAPGNKYTQQDVGDFKQWIGKDGNKLTLRKKNFREEDLDALYPGEIRIMEEIYDEHKDRNTKQIGEATKQGEYDAGIGGENYPGSTPVAVKKIIGAFGWGKEAEEDALDSYRHQRVLGQIVKNG